MTLVNTSSRPGMSATPYQPSDPSHVTVILKLIPLILIFLASLIGNILLARSASRGTYRKTGTNMVILSQSIADLGTTCLVIPFAIVAVCKDRWIVGQALCQLNGFLNMLFTVATLYNLSLLAYDRFLVIVHKKHRVLSRGEARIGIISLWLISFVFSFPWMDYASNHIRTVYTPGFYICYLRYYHPLGALEIFILVFVLFIGAAIPSAIITYCFYRIISLYREHRVRVTPVFVSNVTKFAMEEYSRSVYTSLLMIGTTMIFVLPSCFTLFIEGLQVASIPYSFETATKWIMWCHCTIKPIIYICRNKKWRRNFGRHLQSFLPTRALFYGRPPPKSRACVIFKNSETSSNVPASYMSKKFNEEDIVRRKNLGIHIPKEAWSEERFVDLCAKES